MTPWSAASTPCATSTAARSRVALEHPRTVMIVLAVTVALNFYLYTIIPKGFFPQQDTGTLTGNLRADQSISFQAMRRSCAAS